MESTMAANDQSDLSSSHPSENSTKPKLETAPAPSLLVTPASPPSSNITAFGTSDASSRDEEESYQFPSQQYDHDLFKEWKRNAIPDIERTSRNQDQDSTKPSLSPPSKMWDFDDLDEEGDDEPPALVEASDTADIWSDQHDGWWNSTAPLFPEDRPRHETTWSFQPSVQSDGQRLEITEDEAMALAIEESLKTLSTDEPAVASMIAGTASYNYEKPWDPNSEVEPSIAEKWKELVRTAYYAVELEKLHFERIMESRLHSDHLDDAIPSNFQWGEVSPVLQVLLTYLALNSLESNPARDRELSDARERVLVVMGALDSIYPRCRLQFPLDPLIDANDTRIEEVAKLWVKIIKEKTLLDKVGEKSSMADNKVVEEDVDYETEAENEKFSQLETKLARSSNKLPDPRSYVANLKIAEKETKDEEISDALTADELFDESFELESDGEDTELEDEVSEH